METTTLMGYRSTGIRWRYNARDLHRVAMTTTFQPGTLVSDIWEAPAKELVWPGAVTDTASKSAERNNAAIDSGIGKDLRNFPLGEGS